MQSTGLVDAGPVLEVDARLGDDVGHQFLLEVTDEAARLGRYQPSLPRAPSSESHGLSRTSLPAGLRAACCPGRPAPRRPRDDRPARRLHRVGEGRWWPSPDRGAVSIALATSSRASRCHRDPRVRHRVTRARRRSWHPHAVAAGRVKPLGGWLLRTDPGPGRAAAQAAELLPWRWAIPAPDRAAAREVAPSTPRWGVRRWRRSSAPGRWTTRSSPPAGPRSPTATHTSSSARWRGPCAPRRAAALDGERPGGRRLAGAAGERGPGPRAGRGRRR